MSKNHKVLINLIGVQSSKSTIAPGSFLASAWQDAGNLDGLVTGMEVDYGGSPDDNAKLEVLTSPDGSTSDTTAYALFEVTYTASTTLMKSLPINVDMANYRIKISNQDSTDDIDVWGFGTVTRKN